MIKNKNITKKQRKQYLDLLNKKKIYSNISWELIHFVDDIENPKFKNYEPYSDGFFLIDTYPEDSSMNVEDDITQMHIILKDQTIVNYSDFITHFKDDSDDEDEKVLLTAIKKYIANRTIREKICWNLTILKKKILEILNMKQTG